MRMDCEHNTWNEVFIVQWLHNSISRFELRTNVMRINCSRAWPDGTADINLGVIVRTKLFYSLKSGELCLINIV